MQGANVQRHIPVQSWFRSCVHAVSTALASVVCCTRIALVVWLGVGKGSPLYCQSDMQRAWVHTSMSHTVNRIVRVHVMSDTARRAICKDMRLSPSLAGCVYIYLVVHNNWVRRSLVSPARHAAHVGVYPLVLQCQKPIRVTLPSHTLDA